MPAVQKALRVAARAGLVVARPIIGRADYEFVRGQMDAEAARERAAKETALLGRATATLRNAKK